MPDITINSILAMIGDCHPPPRSYAITARFRNATS